MIFRILGSIVPKVVSSPPEEFRYPVSYIALPPGGSNTHICKAFRVGLHLSLSSFGGMLAVVLLCQNVLPS